MSLGYEALASFSGIMAPSDATISLFSRSLPLSHRAALSAPVRDVPFVLWWHNCLAVNSFVRCSSYGSVSPIIFAGRSRGTEVRCSFDFTRCLEDGERREFAFLRLDCNGKWDRTCQGARTVRTFNLFDLIYFIITDLHIYVRTFIYKYISVFICITPYVY